MTAADSELRNYFFVFLRHGESVGNAEDRFQGQSDFPLTERGQAQAVALAERWQGEGITFDLCISSPLLRARQTAEIVAGRLEVPLEFDPVWKELHNGLLAGLRHEEAAERFPRPDFIHPYLHIGGTGESRWEVYLRAGRGVQSLLDRPWRYPEHGPVCHPGHPGPGGLHRSDLPLHEHFVCYPDVYT